MGPFEPEGDADALRAVRPKEECILLEIDEQSEWSEKNERDRASAERVERLRLRASCARVHLFGNSAFLRGGVEHVLDESVREREYERADREPCGGKEKRRDRECAHPRNPKIFPHIPVHAGKCQRVRLRDHSAETGVV